MDAAREGGLGFESKRRILKRKRRDLQKIRLAGWSGAALRATEVKTSREFVNVRLLDVKPDIVEYGYVMHA